MGGAGGHAAAEDRSVVWLLLRIVIEWLGRRAGGGKGGGPGAGM